MSLMVVLLHILSNTREDLVLSYFTFPYMASVAGVLRMNVRSGTTTQICVYAANSLSLLNEHKLAKTVAWYAQDTRLLEAACSL